MERAELFSSTPFRVISLSFLKPVLARATRRMPLCCFTRKRAVITGAESRSRPLAGSHRSAPSAVNDMRRRSHRLCFYNRRHLFGNVFKPTASEEKCPHLCSDREITRICYSLSVNCRNSHIQLGCLGFEQWPEKHKLTKPAIV